MVSLRMQVAVDAIAVDEFRVLITFIRLVHQTPGLMANRLCSPPLGCRRMLLDICATIGRSRAKRRYQEKSEESD